MVVVVSGRHARPVRRPAGRMARRARLALQAACRPAGRITHRAYVTALLAGLAVTGGWFLYVMANPMGKPW